VSDRHYELTVCNGGNARFNMAGVADSTRGVTRQIDPASADVRSAGLYPIGGSSEQDRILASPR